MTENRQVTNPKNRKRKLLRRYCWQCIYCRRPMTPEIATLEHVIPRSHGGCGGVNLRPCCWDCNQRASQLVVMRRLSLPRIVMRERPVHEQRRIVDATIKMIRAALWKDHP